MERQGKKGGRGKLILRNLDLPYGWWASLTSNAWGRDTYKRLLRQHAAGATNAREHSSL